MKIQESAENYLEVIYTLHQQTGHVRAIDIASHLGYSKPSVSRAVKLLRENDYIFVSQGGQITLSEKGLVLAENIHERHTLLAKFLMKIGVSETVAFDDACKMEHVISEESFTCLKAYLLEE